MKTRWTSSVLSAAAMMLPALGNAQESPAIATTPEAVAAQTPSDAPVETRPSTATAVEPANTEAGSSQANRPASRLIEEIVVTAQKREENIQDVPISITAFSAEKLDALGIQSAEDLERVTPGLTITNAVGFNVAYLRGVGTDAFLPGADSSVPFYLDGVPLLGAQGSSDTLGRISRVEVLKGPQGTLFGRNSTGGAISIITPEPDQKLSGDIDLEYGNYAQRKALGYINLPITDGLAASISAFGITQNNFYTDDTGPIIGVYSWGGRAKLRWDATENGTLTLAGSYQQSSNNGGLTFENTRVAPVFRAVLPQDPKADRHVSYDSLAGARGESYLFSATYDQKAPWFDVKLIGSDQRLNEPFVQSDFDKSDLPIVNIRSIKQLSKQTTGELQILSNKDTPFSDRFKWVAGFFYIHSSGGFDPIAFTLLPDAPTAFANVAGIGANGLNNFLGNISSVIDGLTALTGQSLAQGVTVYDSGVLESSAYSTYLQGSLTIIDSLDLTLGGRFQHEDRALVDSALGVPTSGGGEQILLKQSPPTLHSNQFSPRIALQWRPFGEDSQIYSSWARGYKSPTYNTVNLLGGLPTTIAALRQHLTLAAPDIQPLKAERVDTYELGIKSDLFDRSLRVDTAVFYTKQHDLLTGFVSLESGGVVSYANAPEARIRGAETDITWSPLRHLDPGLVLTTSATYLDGKYTKYPNGKGFDTTTGLAFGPDGTEVLPARNFAGNRIVRTPNFTGNAGISQTTAVGSGSLETAVDGNYSSGFFFLPQGDDLYKRYPYALFNGHITYIYDPWGVQFTAYCNNLLDREYNEIVFVDDFGRNQVLNAPRTFGVRGKWSF